jgi:hypothetical protein
MCLLTWIPLATLLERTLIQFGTMGDGIRGFSKTYEKEELGE